MNKKIKICVLLLIICTLLSACQNENTDSHNGVTVTTSLEGKDALVGDIPCAFPLSKEKTALSIISAGYGDIASEDIYVWQQYAKMTNVDVKWTTVKKEDRAETVYNVLSNKQSIDLIMRCKVSATRLTQYGESGLILDLSKDGLLEKYAPNCWAYLKSHPDALASVTDPSGAIYSLPQVNSGAQLRVKLKLFVNKNWLANVKMELPKTTEEFYALLKAFRDTDANGNGNKDDEIPLCCQDWQSVEEAMFGSFGLANRGAHNLTVDCDTETGGVRLIAACDGYRDYLEYMHTLYAEKLLDSYAFTLTDKQWLNNISNDLVGVISSTNLALLPADKAGNWVAIEEALEGPSGYKMWTAIRANLHSTGAAVIPAACKNPELVLRWLDYFWTDEGTLFYHMGIEGETFTVDEDGSSYDYTKKIYDEMKVKNKSFDDIVAEYSPYPGGGNPTVEIAPYFMGGEMADIPAQAAEKLFEYGPDEYWPSFTFTAVENEKLSVIRTDIEKYCASMLIDFITGAKPLTEWDDYLLQLEKLKTPEMLVIYQAALDRYNAMTKKP